MQKSAGVWFTRRVVHQVHETGIEACSPLPRGWCPTSEKILQKGQKAATNCFVALLSCLTSNGPPRDLLQAEKTRNHPARNVEVTMGEFVEPHVPGASGDLGEELGLRRNLSPEPWATMLEEQIGYREIASRDISEPFAGSKDPAAD